jgi:hypothetical protein
MTVGNNLNTFGAPPMKPRSPPGGPPPHAGGAVSHSKQLHPPSPNLLLPTSFYPHTPDPSHRATNPESRNPEPRTPNPGNEHVQVRKAECEGRPAKAAGRKRVGAGGGGGQPVGAWEETKAESLAPKAHMRRLVHERRCKCAGGVTVTGSGSAALNPSLHSTT